MAREHRRLASSVRAIVVAASCAIVIATSASVASAAGTTKSCTTRDQDQIFSAWGDTNSYFPMPNGGFEDGSYNWWLSGGASVVWGNEPYNVGGWLDMRSLRMPTGATAESRTICVGVGEDSVRMFVRNPRVPGAVLHIDATVRNISTGAVAKSSYDIDAYDTPYGWSPTARLSIPNLLSGPTDQQELTLRFTAVGTPANWYVDDVYVDPWKLR
jgi:hypothetical protein